MRALAVVFDSHVENGKCRNNKLKKLNEAEIFRIVNDFGGESSVDGKTLIPREVADFHLDRLLYHRRTRLDSYSGISTAAESNTVCQYRFLQCLKFKI